MKCLEKFNLKSIKIFYLNIKMETFPTETTRLNSCNEEKNLVFHIF